MQTDTLKPKTRWMAALLAALLFSCTNKDGAEPPGGFTEEEIVASSSLQQIDQAFPGLAAGFAFDLYREAVKATEPGENTFIAPLSVQMALGMLLNGAEGNTAEEIKAVLGLGGKSLAEINAIYKVYMESLPKLDRKVETSVANSVWHDQNFQVKAPFVERLENVFDAEVSGLDFRSPAAVSAINSWVNRHTNGKIPSILDQIAQDEVLFLINAVYFNGDWKDSFDPQNTGPMPFLLENGSTVEVPTMVRRESKVRWAQREGYVAFEMPYANGTFVMTVLLPNPGTGTKTVAARLGAGEWAALQQNMQEAAGETIFFPKFKVEQTLTLNDALKAMGMQKAFTDMAELTGISDAQRLYVTQVKHKAFVSVDEKGTEAAGATSIGVGVTSLPVFKFQCDRPFIFVISEKTLGTVLFVGQLTNPLAG